MICAATPGFAQTPFTGTYSWGTTGNTNSFPYNGTDILNLTGSAFTKVGITTSGSSGNFRATGFALDPVLNSLTGTNDPTKYFEFSLSAASGFVMNMSNVNFGVGRSGTGPRTFLWRSSVDNFATTITNYIVPAEVTNNSGILTIGDVTSTTLTNIVLNLSGSSFQGLTNLTLRFYAYNAESNTGTGGFQGPLSFSGSLLNTNPVTGGRYWSALAGGGGGGTWVAGGTTWATNAGGLGAGQTQSDSTLIFTDAFGMLTVSGVVNVANGMTFQTTGYDLQGGTISLTGTNIANNAITTETGVTTTISSELAGTAGMTKAGNGRLALSGTNTFSGNAAINAGTLEIANESALGNAANDLANNGTLKTTTSVSLGAGRDLSGSGTYDIANGTTLTVNGNANHTATTLANTGSLDLQGAARTLGAITINAPMTLNAAGAISATGLTAPGVNSGTATINPDIIFTTSGDKTLDVAAGGTVDLRGRFTNSAVTNSRIAKTGSGTLILSGTNTMAGLRLGVAAALPTDGGTLVLKHPAIGMHAQVIQHNYGTLYAATNLVIPNGLSIGGQTNGAATLAGSNLEFQGQSAFFKGSGTTGPVVLNVNNTTTFSGGFGATTGGGSGNNIIIGGNGHMILSGDSSAMPTEIHLTDIVKLTLTSTLGSNLHVGGSCTLAGGGGTVSGNLSFSTGAKLELNLNNPTLTVSGSMVSFVNWTVYNIAGLDSSTPNGTYQLIGGTATVATNGLANIGAENAFLLGNGKAAYFTVGIGLELNVVDGPSIQVSTNSVAAFVTPLGTASGAQAVTVTASNLEFQVTVAAPTGFQVSLNAIDWGTTTSLSRATNGIANGTIYVRLAANNVPGPYSGNVTLSSYGAISQSFSVLGTVRTLYEAWANGETVNSNSLLQYAIGGATNISATNGIDPVGAVTSNNLTLTAIVRTNDTNLTIWGESQTNLTQTLWNSNDVTVSTNGVDQSDVPAGTARKVFSTPRGEGNAKFLRIKVSNQGE